MKKHIDTDRLRAEIEKERKHLEILSQGGGLTEYDYGRLNAFRLIDSIVDSLQKEQPEVDLEKEINRYFEPIRAVDIEFEPFTQMAKCARHFYELGLNARKGEQL